jgi:MFS family permease
MMTVLPSNSRARQNVWLELKEGLSYIRHFTPIRSILTLLSCVSLFGVPYTVLMPLFASDVLQGGPYTLGFLTGATGLGALISAIMLATRRTILGLNRVIAISAFTFGVGLMLFGVSQRLWLSLLLLVVIGFSMMQQMSASNTILQTIVEEDKRGRVMSFYIVAFIGVAPFGSLIAGFAASKIGASFTVMAGGLLCALGAYWFSRRLERIRKVVQPIYVRLGILPEQG